MAVLELSSPSSLAFESAIDDFESQSGIGLNLQRLNWENAWSDIIRMAIYRLPIDVSEVGSSWISELRAMGSLHAFTDKELEILGGEDVFLPASWQNCVSPQDGQVWAIPWTVDTRLIYYRRDLLERANVDPLTAFETNENMSNTLQTLREQGIQCPLTIPTCRSRIMLHTAAPWVWAAGGDFLSPDGRNSLFAQPEALKGFCQYYELGRFMIPEVQNLDSGGSEALFFEGGAAVTVSGPWMIKQRLADEVQANLGIALLPGVPFIGGTNLIVWNHSKDPGLALQLIAFLTSSAFQGTYFESQGYLPSRLDELLSLPMFSNESRLGERIQQGRTFRPLPLWGLVEERLSVCMQQIWHEIFESSGDELCSAIVERNLLVLARRLNLTLEQQS